MGFHLQSNLPPPLPSYEMLDKQMISWSLTFPINEWENWGLPCRGLRRFSRLLRSAQLLGAPREPDQGLAHEKHVLPGTWPWDMISFYLPSNPREQASITVLPFYR